MATPYRPIGGIGRGVPIRSDAAIALGGLTNNVSNFGASNTSSNFGSGNQNFGSNQGGFGGGNQTSGFRSYDFGSSDADAFESDRGNHSGKKPVWPKGKNRGPGGGHKANEYPNGQSGFGGDSGNVGGFGGGGTGQRGPQTCRKCNEEGHFARDCPNGDASGGGFGGRSEGFGGGDDDRGRNRGCFNCGEEGHISKDCTQPRKLRNGGRSGGVFSGNVKSEAQPPKMEYAENEFSNVETSKGGLDQKFYLAAGTQRIGAIIIDDNPDTTMYREFFGLLLETCRDFGMQMPTMIQDRVIRRIPVACAAADLELRLEVFVEMGADLVIVALPQEDSPLYAEVMGNYGVMTQCVMQSTIQETLQKLDRMTIGNLALEMNMKLGGINSKDAAEAQSKKILEEKPTLLLGIDVTYQGQLKKYAPPIATFVGNTDSSFMRYGASVRAHNRRVGVLYLQGQVRERLFEYLQGEGQLNEERKMVGLPLHQTKPQRIIIYRDGVAKGELLQEILKTELVHAREACAMLGGLDYKPSITFIVARKQKKPRGHGGNIWFGTVVDKAMTHPTMFEFCLCGHIQGTSRPIRYHVLTTDNEFTAENMQNLTFYLTHCFGLSTGHVSLPVPLYFADLACRRARIYLQDKMSAFSSDTSSQSGTGPGDAGPAISDEELIKGSAVTPSLKIKLDVD